MDYLAFAGLDIGYFDVGVVVAAATLLRYKQYMRSVGKDLWPAVRAFSFRQLSQRFRGPPGGGDA